MEESTNDYAAPAGPVTAEQPDGSITFRFAAGGAAQFRCEEGHGAGSLWRLRCDGALLVRSVCGKTCLMALL